MHYLKRGEVASRPHLNLPKGTYEEELGLDGFYGPVSHLYHRNPPTAWTNLQKSEFQWPNLEEKAAESLRPQCFRSIESTSEGFFNSYRPFYWNDEVELGIHKFRSSDERYLRNADASELYFCHEGDGVLESGFGQLAYKKSDYIYIPKGISYRFKITEPNYLLRIQAFGSHLKKPDTGLMGQQALYHEENIRPPEFKQLPSDSSSVVLVQNDRKLSQIDYPFDLREVAGWCGTLYPFTLSVLDIAPAMSPVAHLPPSINSSFLNEDFVVCTFLPRPLEEPEGALKVPFYHSNIDYDEVIFYHEGDFFSRDNMGRAYMTLHPRGINHGPHPKALENQSKLKRTNEIAVMLDTRKSLKVSSFAREMEVKDYWKSWQA